jgi:transposase
MRGEDAKQEAMFSYISAEKRVPAEHPLRAIRKLVDAVLQEMSPRFARLYAKNGRPSIAPERLLRALLLQVFYSVRSERLLMEQLDYNLLFRWFVGLTMDDAVWHHAVFSHNRERLLNEELAEVFFQRVLAQAETYLSDEHFTVDGTLIEAWASQKSFRRKDGQGPRDGNSPDFRGEKWSNASQQKSDVRTVPMPCVYTTPAGLCDGTQPLSKNEHYFSRALGNFRDNEPPVDRIWDGCQKICSQLEDVLAHNSPEAFFSRNDWARWQNETQ